MFQICLKKCLLLENLEILYRRHMLLVILNMNKLLEHFTKKELQKKKKKNQKEFRVETVIFLKLKSFEGKIKVELDFLMLIN